MTHKLSQHEQLAEWRRQQKQKSKQNLKSWGDRAKATDFLKLRLRFWGVFLLILGLLTSGLNAVDLYYEELHLQATISVVWGLTVAAIAVAVFFKVSIVMLGMLGCFCLLHGILVYLTTSTITGSVLVIGAVVIGIDVVRAWQDEMQKVTTMRLKPSPGKQANLSQTPQKDGCSRGQKDSS